jgi:hypothetical protein
VVGHPVAMVVPMDQSARQTGPFRARACLLPVPMMGQLVSRQPKQRRQSESDEEGEGSGEGPAVRHASILPHPAYGVKRGGPTRRRA